MQALIQRVSRAAVRINHQTHGAIESGLLVFLCAETHDSAAQADLLLAKILKLRIFSDAAGKMNLSLQDTGGGLLIVSQFTLAADTRKGNRPSFTQAAPPEQGRALYDYFVAAARRLHPIVATGEFGADMAVELINDGPVTIPLHIPAPSPHLE